MKGIKNKIIAGAIGLAGMLNPIQAKAHETISHPQEYQITLGQGMSTWKAIEKLFYGDLKGAEREQKEQREISHKLVLAYAHNLWEHQLPEIDKHKYNTESWKDHMKLIKKMRSDYTGFGDIEYLTWIKRTTGTDKSDGLAMELRPGDSFYMPDELLNEDIAEALDKEDGTEDRKITVDSTPVSRAIEIAEEEPELVPCEGYAAKPKIAATAGYLSEKLDGETFLDGPKFNIDFDLEKQLGTNWSLAVNMDNQYVNGTFYSADGTVKAIESEIAVSFDYKLNDNIRLGIGPRASVLKADINYDGNKASLMDAAIGPEATAKLRTKHLDATADYAYNLGTGGDSMQGYNPLTKNKLDLEATIHINPVHLNLGYEYEQDKQKVRGVKRDNSDQTLEASLDYDATETLSLTAGYELNLHESPANKTTATAYKGGAKIRW